MTDPQMQRTVGMTEAELRALEQDGVLQPRTRLPGARLRWLKADGQALVDELNTLAEADPGTAKWETIQTAQANSKISVGRIIAAIRARQIRVHAPAGNRSYHGFKVCRSEFGAIESKTQHVLPLRPHREAAKKDMLGSDTSVTKSSTRKT